MEYAQEDMPLPKDAHSHSLLCSLIVNYAQLEWHGDITKAWQMQNCIGLAVCSSWSRVWEETSYIMQHKASLFNISLTHTLEIQRLMGVV